MPRLGRSRPAAAYVLIRRILPVKPPVVVHNVTAQLTVTPVFLAYPQHKQAPGGWWQYLDIQRYREQEFAFYATNPPMSCPRCGEPLTNAPPTDAGSSVELFCKFDGWQFPRDWMRP